MRKYNKNDSYFQEMSNQSAYWAGFIAADGCVFPENNTLHISVHPKDKMHLEMFASDINYTGNVATYQKKRQTLCVLQLSSAQFIKDLSNIYCITKAKTLTLQPPNISDVDLVKSFIVGFIDGDGNIRITKRNCTVLQITCASKDMALWLNGVINNLFGGKTKLSTYYNKGYHNVYYKIHYGKKVAKRIKDFVLLNKINVLKRKWDIVDMEESA